MTTSDSSPSETPEIRLTGNDIGFILSGEFGPRTCPCSYCIGLAQKLQSMLNQCPRIPPEEQL